MKRLAPSGTGKPS